MRIPVFNRPATLRIDDKPATKCHEGNIIVGTICYYLLIVRGLSTSRTQVAHHMVQTRDGAMTYLASPAAGSGENGPSMMEKAKANENARLDNEIWFNKFKDGPTLDAPIMSAMMKHFDAGNVYLLEVTTKKNCKEMLTEEPGDDPVLKNYAKNIQMFFNEIICDILKNELLEGNSKDAYETLCSLRPYFNVKRIKILKKVQDISPTNISEYAIAIKRHTKIVKIH